MTDGKSKRGQNEGSWRQRSSGSWELRFSFKNEHGWSQRGSAVGRTKEDARERRDQIVNAAKDGLRRVQRAKVPTLQTWVDSWIDIVLPHSGIDASTVKAYRSLISNHVRCHSLAKKKLNDIRPSELQALVGEAHKVRSPAPLSHSSRRNLHAALVACLESAVVDGLLSSNPMRKAKRPKNPNPGRQAEARALSTVEVDAILGHIEDHRYAVLVKVALLTGMRRGELIALSWDSISFDTESIRVREQITGGSDDPVEPKTAAGDRVISMGEELHALLVQHGIDQQIRNERLENPRRDLVFTNRSGQQIDTHALSRWYLTAAREAKIKETGLHALRHTIISRWVAAGIPITTVASWAGHADPSITLRLCAWALPVDSSDYANRVGLTTSTRAPLSHYLSPTHSDLQPTADASRHAFHS